MSDIKKCYIAFPTHGRDKAAIMADIEAASAAIRENGMEPVFGLRGDAAKPKDGAEALLRTAKLLERLAECGAVYFCKGYKSSRVCQIFEYSAKLYKLTCIYAEPPQKKRRKKPQNKAQKKEA